LGLKKVVGERGGSYVNGVVSCARLLLSERVAAGDWKQSKPGTGRRPEIPVGMGEAHPKCQPHDIKPRTGRYIFPQPSQTFFC